MPYFLSATPIRRLEELKILIDWLSHGYISMLEREFDGNSEATREQQVGMFPSFQYLKTIELFRPD